MLHIVAQPFAAREGLVHPITLCAAKKYVNRKVSSKKSKRIWWSEEHMRLHLFSVFY